MDPISLIIAALAAGAIAGVKDTAGQAVKDAYAGLKALVHRRFAGNRDAEAALDQSEQPTRIRPGSNSLSICALRAQPMMKSSSGRPRLCSGKPIRREPGLGSTTCALPEGKASWWATLRMSR